MNDQVTVEAAAVIAVLRRQLDEANYQLAVVTARAEQAEAQLALGAPVE